MFQEIFDQKDDRNTVESCRRTTNIIMTYNTAPVLLMFRSNHHSVVANTQVQPATFQKCTRGLRLRPQEGKERGDQKCPETSAGI